MKPHTVCIDINLPRDKVVELFDSPDDLFKWQPGLQSFEHISGTPGEPGAKSKLVSLNGKRRIELIQTVTKRNLPDEFNGTYEWLLFQSLETQWLEPEHLCHWIHRTITIRQ